MKIRFMRFRFAAIKRHGNKTWHTGQGYIEFNANYVVCATSLDDYELLRTDYDVPFIVELSNGTKFLTYFNEPDKLTDGVISVEGEASNHASADENYQDARAIRSLTY